MQMFLNAKTMVAEPKQADVRSLQGQPKLLFASGSLLRFNDHK